MSAGAIIAARQKRYVASFINATAIDEETARPLSDLGCDDDGAIFRGLVRRGVLVETEDGRWHVDQLAWTRLLEKRRVVMLGVLLLLLLGLLLAVLTTVLT
ncbi:MAG: hypothetical protein DHS20C15_15880 [Planctomycetota bacterium]|nr:MAG: hypothetical protein DHS20C15_15880 [Planctomycetota bacterium]